MANWTNWKGCMTALNVHLILLKIPIVWNDLHAVRTGWRSPSVLAAVCGACLTFDGWVPALRNWDHGFSLTSTILEARNASMYPNTTSWNAARNASNIQGSNHFVGKVNEKNWCWRLGSSPSCPGPEIHTEHQPGEPEPWQQFCPWTHYSLAMSWQWPCSGRVLGHKAATLRRNHWSNWPRTLHHNTAQAKLRWLPEGTYIKDPAQRTSAKLVTNNCTQTHCNKKRPTQNSVAKLTVGVGAACSALMNRSLLMLDTAARNMSSTPNALQQQLNPIPEIWWINNRTKHRNSRHSGMWQPNALSTQKNDAWSFGHATNSTMTAAHAPIAKKQKWQTLWLALLQWPLAPTKAISITHWKQNNMWMPHRNDARHWINKWLSPTRRARILTNEQPICTQHVNLNK